MATKDLIEREMPQFRELEKEFHDRQESFEQTKKELVGNGDERIITLLYYLVFLLINSVTN